MPIEEILIIWKCSHCDNEWYLKHPQMLCDKCGYAGYEKVNKPEVEKDNVI